MQVNIAFSIVYNSGINEYALYLDCEGDRTYHKGYEMTMSHLFKTYRKNTHTYKVSAFHPWTNAIHFLFFWSHNSAPILVSRWSSLPHVCGQSPTLHQQFRSDPLAEPRQREESPTHTWCFASVGHLQVRFMKMRENLQCWGYCGWLKLRG